MKKSAILAVDIINILDMEIAAWVAQWAVLEEIYLVDAKINREPLLIAPEALSLEHKCSTEILENDQEKKLYSILCNFRVAAVDGKSPDKLVMKIEASFCASYVMKDLPDILIPVPAEDDSPDTLLAYLEHLTTINPISNTWPYWREFVQSMSNRMGFPALTVPLLEIAPKKSAPQKAKRQPAKKESARRKKPSA
jgi:hypothetical protein